MTKLTIVAGVILVGNLFSAQAENLNRKYGPSWNCSYISASLPGLNCDCKQCEDQGKQFDQTSNDAGRCVTKGEQTKNTLQNLKKTKWKRPIGETVKPHLKSKGANLSGDVVCASLLT